VAAHGLERQREGGVMTMQDSNIDLEQLQQRIAEGDVATAAAELRQVRPADQAEFLHALPTPDELTILTTLSASQISAVLEYLVPKGQEALEPLSQLPTDVLTAILDRTPTGTAVRVLRAFPPERRLEVLAGLRDPSPIESLIGQEEDTAGALVTTDFMALRVGMTANQAVWAIRRSRPVSEFLQRLFVVDRQDKLVGSVSFRDLLLADPRTPLTRIMEEDPLSVPAGTDQEEVANVVQRYRLDTLPIVDEGGKLLGFVDAADVLPVAVEEVQEDMYRIVGLSEEESIRAPVWTSLRRRLPWLSVNLVTAFAAASVVGMFENTIARAAILAAFLPIVGGQGGNAAIQALTITVRSIAVGDITLQNAYRVLLKEATLGFFDGLTIGVLAGLAGFVWTRNLALSIVLAVALMMNLVVAGVAGVLLPLTLKRLGVDPALASGIFATMCTDIAGFAILLGLATVTLAALGI
jgi:magnesium transporter